MVLLMGDGERGTVDGLENPTNSPEVGSLSYYFEGFCTFQVVHNFWTINSMDGWGGVWMGGIWKGSDVEWVGHRILLDLWHKNMAGKSHEHLKITTTKPMREICAPKNDWCSLNNHQVLWTAVILSKGGGGVESSPNEKCDHLSTQVGI